MKYLALLFCLLPVTAFAQQKRTIPNRALNQDLCLNVNVAGTPTDELCVNGADGKIKAIGGFDTTGGAGLATSAAQGVVYGKDNVTDQNDTSWSDNVISDLGAQTLIMPAGTYLVNFGTTFRVQTTGLATGDACIGYLYITDSSNTFLSSSDEYESSTSIPRRGADGITDQYMNQFSKIIKITLGSQTTVKLRAKINYLGASPSVVATLRAYMVWERI